MIGNRTSFINNPLTRQGQEYTRLRVTSETDISGNVIKTTSNKITVKLVMGNISRKDYVIHEMGLAETGNMKIYFDWSQDIKNNDFLIRGGTKWRVEAITSEYPEVYRIGIVRNFGLDNDGVYDNIGILTSEQDETLLTEDGEAILSA